MPVNRKTGPSRRPAGHRAAARQGAGGATGSLVVAAAFLGFVALAVLGGWLPAALLGVYLGASVLAFVAYAMDKSAARKQERRTSERTLHLLALVGGWPGALLAQQLLRHKSSKAPFRMVFWATVLVNCMVVAWLLGAPGAGMPGAILPR